ncbi:hypothetical protein FK268_12810 [Tsukamurella sputi]|uniref:Uncharacterized protein n=1 Tax=Tsukamurella sputi TaxID=2591848 RepID=A0A5C5RKT4_9ACTN|nr:hypothetical protein [Tsukamurella sputi]TWS23194.1 hypothetical protein FK268_12810 [Tsukamurella sputi]
MTDHIVPRAEDFPDAVVWRPFEDDPKAELIAYRPGESFDPALPVMLRMGHTTSHLFALTREDVQRLIDALQQADEVAGGAA